ALAGHLHHLEVSIAQFFVQVGQFFVGRLQFFLGRFQFFVGRLQFFVARLDFFVARLQLFVGRFLLFDDGLQRFLGRGQFPPQFADFTLGRGFSQRAGPLLGLCALRRLVENNQQPRFVGARDSKWHRLNI